MADVIDFPFPGDQPHMAETLRLIKAFIAIPDASARKRVILLAEKIAKAGGGAEPRSSMPRAQD